MSQQAGTIVTLSSNREVYVEKHDRSDGTFADTPDIPILFVHGFMMDCSCWHSLLPYFPQYTRILFDHEPHGKTPLSGHPITFHTIAQDARDVLTHLGYDKAFVVGHSAGALLALQVAATFPKAVQKLVLITPMNVPPPPDAELRRQIFRNATMEQLVELHISFLSPKRRTDPVLGALITKPMHEQASRKSLLDEYFDQIMYFDFRGNGGAETWVVHATEDAIITNEVTDHVARLTNAKVLDVNTGHFPMFEDVPGLAKVLSQILAP